MRPASMRRALLTLLAGAALAVIVPAVVRKVAAASNTQVHRINQ